MAWTSSLLLSIFIFCIWATQAWSNEFVLPMIAWEEQFSEQSDPNEFIAVQINTGKLINKVYQNTLTKFHIASLLAANLINGGVYPNILPNTTILLDVRVDHLSAAVAVEAMIDFALQGHTLVVGFPFSHIAEATGIVATEYGVAQLASMSASSLLSNERIYPYFSRLAASVREQAEAMRDTILYFSNISGPGWKEVAIMSTVNGFTTNIATNFIDLSEGKLEISSYQQALLGETDVSVELNEIKRSGARVILCLYFGDWISFIITANDFGLVGESYVWIVPETVSLIPFPAPSFLSRGVIGVNVHIPVDTPEVQNYFTAWEQADPMKYPGAGPGTFPTTVTYRAFDMMITAAIAIDTLEKQGKLNGQRIPAEVWSSTIKEISFHGVSGFVSFDNVGNRIESNDVTYYNPEQDQWIVCGIWTHDTGFQQIADVVWFSNTTELPDLDIREPFHYWSCDEKKLKYDETGKTVSLGTPDGGTFDDIDSDYHCDYFLDCKNMSDESNDCSSDYIIVFIVFGIITGILIIVLILFSIFVVIFGLCFQYRRLRKASPVFLLVLLVSIFLGYVSVYSWFGRPHPVACGFQPWLLGLPTISMIAALSVKNFRIWRIFKFPMKKTRISDLELALLWVVVMIPGIIILLIWTIVSTPTATMEDRDGKDHFVCATGGFTGEPGGVIFFFIFVGYSSIVLLFGAFISFVTRNVPSEFNESKLITISIYNLGFLGAIIIPVFFVLQPINPFVAWILRTCAILYAFTATMVLQFIPLVWRVAIIDKGKNVRVFKTMKIHTSSSNINS